MRQVLMVTGLSPLGVALLAVLGIAPLFIENQYVLQLLVGGLLLGSQAMALDFTVGLIGVVNFGFAAFVGLGAYTSALVTLRTGVTPWMGLAAGAAAGANISNNLVLLDFRPGDRPR